MAKSVVCDPASRGFVKSFALQMVKVLGSFQFTDKNNNKRNAVNLYLTKEDVEVIVPSSIVRVAAQDDQYKDAFTINDDDTITIDDEGFMLGCDKNELVTAKAA
jgi:hypothetical protein